MFSKLGKPGKGIDTVRCIITAGLPDGSLQRTTNEGNGTVTAGLFAATGALGRYEEGSVLATACVVVEVYRVLDERPRQVRFSQHLAQTGLTSLKF